MWINQLRLPAARRIDRALVHAIALPYAISYIKHCNVTLMGRAICQTDLRPLSPSCKAR